MTQLSLGFGRWIETYLIGDELFQEALRRGFIDLLANKDKLSEAQRTELERAINTKRAKRRRSRSA